MTLKKCPTCGLESESRKLACSCGFVFIKPSEASGSPMMSLVKAVATKQAKKQETPPESIQRRYEASSLANYSRNLTKVATPSGGCPATPAGNSTLDISAWISRVVQAGKSNGILYTHEAVIYFAREFWQFNSPDYIRVKKLVQELLF